MPALKKDSQTAINFRFLRQSLDLTLYAMAEELCIRRSTLMRYETGERSPSLKMCDKIIAFSKRCGVDVDKRFLRPDLALSFDEHSN